MLNKQEKQKLKTKAHALKAIILMGQKGMHDALIEEIDIALDTHELIKIKLSGEDRAAVKSNLEEINERSNSETVMFVGHTATIYRRNPKVKVPVL